VNTQVVRRMGGGAVRGMVAWMNKWDDCTAVRLIGWIDGKSKIACLKVCA
jgi:hypothetical protein